MTPNEYYKKHTRKQLKQMTKTAGTTIGNFQQIAIAGGSVSKDMATRLAEASNFVMEREEILYPEEYAQAAS